MTQAWETKCSATRRRKILPVAVLGKESVMKTFLGTLKDVRFFLQYFSTSSASMFDPSLGMIAQCICSKVKHINRIIFKKLIYVCYNHTPNITYTKYIRYLMNLKISFLFVNMIGGSIIIIRKFAIHKTKQKINNIFKSFHCPYLLNFSCSRNFQYITIKF